MNKEKQALERDVATALLAAGFRKINKHKFKRAINPETEVFVYPAIRSGRSYLEIGPIVGVENMTLNSRLKALDPKQDTRVCHILLGSIRGVRDLWGGHFDLYASKGESTTHIVQLFIAALEKFALPKFSAYDSKEKVTELLRLYAESFQMLTSLFLTQRKSWL